MTRLSIELPDELDERARSRAADEGHSSVEAYLRSLLVDDIELGEAAPPPAQHVTDLSHLTALVRAGLESGPAVELTDADWERKRQDLIRRHSGRNACFPLKQMAWRLCACCTARAISLR